jgi:Putative peptidoglycan binding domain
MWFNQTGDGPITAKELKTAMVLPASAQSRVFSGSHGGRTFVGNHFCRPYWHGGTSVSIGFGFPFYGGFYGYPYYGDYYPPYGGYYPGYGYGYSPYYGSGYGNGYGYGAPVYGRPAYGGGSRGSTVARVQERLARSGYYEGSVDGVMGPRTRSAIRAYERRHGLPVDGAIDPRLLATMGLA